MATAEEARAELARRRAARAQASSGATPEMARAELARRQGAQGSTDALSAATRGAGDTLTFGFMDELASGLYAPVGAALDAVRGRGFDLGRAYNRQLGRERAMDAADQQQRPGARIAGQVTGGLMMGLASAPASLSARAAGGGLGLRALAGATDGLIGGALYGAGSGTDTASRARGSVQAGLTGAGVGAAFPLLGAAAGAGYRAARNAFQAAPIARQAGIRPETARLLGGLLSADDSLGPAGQAGMARAGREAMLADTGPTAAGVLDTAVQRGGPGARIASDRITARTTRDAQALIGVLDDTLGGPQGVTAARTAIRQGSAAARREAYERAYEQAIDYTGEAGRRVEDLVRNRVPPEAISAANRLMRAEGAQSQQILARVADDGSVAFERLPDVRQLDYITRGLNEVADQADGAGKLGGTTAIGRAYGDLSREIRSTLRDLVPAYGKALETAADPIRRSQAVKLGSEILSPRITRDQVAEAVGGMTGPERDALAQGVRSQIDDAMARVTRTVADDDTAAREAIAGLRTLSSRANREKVALAIGEERAAPLFDELDRVAQSFNLRASLTANSRTFGRQAINQRVQDMTAPGAIGTAARGEPVNAGRRIIQALTGQTDDALMARQDAIYAEIADLLTRQGGAGQSAYDAAARIGATDAQTQAAIDIIRQMSASPTLSYPSTIQLQNRPPQ